MGAGVAVCTITRRHLTLAREAGMTIAFLLCRAGAPTPEIHLAGLKATVAANRRSPTVAELTDPAVDLGTMSEEDRLRRCGFQSSEFNWLLA